MIYILLGNDIKKKNAYLKKLYKDDQLISVLDGTITKEILFDQAHSLSLFGGSPVVIVENVIKEGDIILSPSDLLILKDSATVFVFLEEKLLALDSKKYKKYSTIEEFNEQIVKQAPKMKVFDIAEAFSRKDKIGSWILYREAVLAGVSPEEISGIIFWKIKTMLLSGTKFFTPEELKIKSSGLVSIYHKSHRGECDFVIGLEQFILSSLSKN
ncbi:MAG TPA: hypothetical protein VIK86_06750 [Candidatus Paceibacterota bacterium]